MTIADRLEALSAAIDEEAERSGAAKGGVLALTAASGGDGDGAIQPRAESLATVLTQVGGLPLRGWAFAWLGVLACPVAGCSVHRVCVNALLLILFRRLARASLVSQLCLLPVTLRLVSVATAGTGGIFCGIFRPRCWCPCTSYVIDANKKISRECCFLPRGVSLKFLVLDLMLPAPGHQRRIAPLRCRFTPAQALQSGDESLLEQCLSVGDQGMIEATVERLPSSKVLQFLLR